MKRFSFDSRTKYLLFSLHFDFLGMPLSKSFFSCSELCLSFTVLEIYSKVAILSLEKLKCECCTEHSLQKYSTLILLAD